MSIALLDINDSNLQLWHGGAHLQSPGYALLVDRQYRFGNPARAAARLQPRDINTRFWWQLSTEALQPALGPARHTGDLVHAQLQELHREGGQPREVLMAVSGTMERNQLALLLGIVQQCPFAAVGLVNRSVLLGSVHGAADRLFHLEIQLHQAVISELARRDGQVELQRTVPLPGAGLLQLQERLVEIIATAFIRQTRFDPRRKAITEQQLYDTLPDALRALGRDSEANIEVNGYRARINRGELLAAGQRLFDSAREAMGVLNPGDRVIADPVAGLLPGLAEQLPGLEVLAPDSVRIALEQHIDVLVQREQALSFVTVLPSLAPGLARDDTGPAAIAPVPLTPTKPAATHLLEGHRARPLASEGTSLGGGWSLRHTATGWQLAGGGAAVLVNGAPGRAEQALGGGDTIRVGDGAELQLIEVRR
ncbi:MAG: hypothetical protein V2I26_17325 [Halieaceae bacterium]|jgi:hypothetical protein|nr:hypothetical protein [Halieaceae bacterium]